MLTPVEIRIKLLTIVNNNLVAAQMASNYVGEDDELLATFEACYGMSPAVNQPDVLTRTQTAVNEATLRDIFVKSGK